MKDIHSSLSIQISYILYANDKSIFARDMLAVAYTSLLDMLDGQAPQNLLPGNSLLLISYLHLCQQKQFAKQLIAKLFQQLLPNHGI